MSRIDELIKALRYMDEPPMRFGYDGHYKWYAEDIGRDAAAEITRMFLENERLRAERDVMLKDLNYGEICETCAHSGIDGYPDMAFFKCEYLKPDMACGNYKWRGSEENDEQN